MQKELMEGHRTERKDQVELEKREEVEVVKKIPRWMIKG